MNLPEPYWDIKVYSGTLSTGFWFFLTKMNQMNLLLKNQNFGILKTQLDFEFYVDS